MYSYSLTNLQLSKVFTNQFIHTEKTLRIIENMHLLKRVTNLKNI